jgi:hypothetical protein
MPPPFRASRRVDALGIDAGLWSWAMMALAKATSSTGWFAAGRQQRPTFHECEAADVVTAVAPWTSIACSAKAAGMVLPPGRSRRRVRGPPISSSTTRVKAHSSSPSQPGDVGEINECKDSAAAPGAERLVRRIRRVRRQRADILCTVEGGTHCGGYGSFILAEVAWGSRTKRSLVSRRGHIRQRRRLPIEPPASCSFGLRTELRPPTTDRRCRTD